MTADEVRLIQLEFVRQTNMAHYGFGTSVMKNIRICPECGLPSSAAEKNCRSCGGKLPKETLFQQYRKRHKCCSHCETVVAKHAQFCPECGTRLGLMRPKKFFW